MVTQGLLVRLEAAHGRDQELETFLASALEANTSASFAVRFGRSEYGIVGFPGGAIPIDKQLLASEPRSEKLSVLASKLPAAAAVPAITRGLLLTFQAKEGHVPQVEQFLRGAQALVEAEPGTVAWFALRLESGAYGIFDVFPDNGARFAHLTGAVPRELTKHALSLLGGVPDMDLLQVLAARFAAG